MKQGKELGQAIGEAVELKIDGIKYRTKADIARACGVQPPSLHGWVRTGRINGDRLMKVLDIFADVTTPQHWGLEDWPPAVYADPDAHVFVEIAVNTTLPITVAQQVLELISKNAIER
jgi:hypothetical protein